MTYLGKSASLGILGVGRNPLPPTVTLPKGEVSTATPFVVEVTNV